MVKRNAFKAIFTGIISSIAVACSEQPLVLAEENAEFDAEYAVVYAEEESGRLKADLYLPKSAGRHPGVLVVHGGAWRAGTRAQLSGVAQLLAKRGYTAVAISYRLAPAHKFPAQIEDCQTAVRWMRKNAERLKLDPERIAGFGYSAGAHLVSLLGALDDEAVDAHSEVEEVTDVPSARLQAVVAGGAPCEFRTIPPKQRWLSFWLGGTREQVPDAYRLASPVAFVTPDDPPMFFYHGENDRLVPLESPQLMKETLATAGVPADLYIVPEQGHLFAATDRDAIEQAISFLDEHLKTRASP